MLPEARIVHNSLNRLRLKIDSRRGQDDYFSLLKDIFAKHFGLDNLSANSITGSLLFTGDIVDSDAIAECAEANGLFRIIETEKRPKMTAVAVTKPIRSANVWLKQFTDGDVDLPGIIFMSLLAFGTYELLRGRISSPPWYTAFWYSLGIFSKYIFDKAADADQNLK